MLDFFARLPPCLIGMEACAGAHFRARHLTTLGHDVRLMPPSCVKAYEKRGKTDAADAGAICEAVTRPSMRFVPVKSDDQQAVLMMHRTRDFLVRQLTQVTNALRAHLGEFGVVAPKGVHNVERLLASAEIVDLPENARGSVELLAEQFRDTQTKIEDVTAAIKAAAARDEAARRLQSIPGIGPITSPPRCRRSPAFGRRAISPHGSVSRRSRIRAAARKGSGASPGWATAISGDCSISGRWA